MDLKLDEQLLLADFQRLEPAARKELLDHAALLVKKSRVSPAEGGEQTSNQCRLTEQAEKRPESAKEPFFTE